MENKQTVKEFLLENNKEYQNLKELFREIGGLVAHAF